MAATNPFGYNNWLLHHNDHDDKGGDEFLLGDKNDLTAGNDHKDQGNATILMNLANVNMTLAGCNLATGSGVGVFGESDADFVLYGHTHHQLVRRYGKVLVINPGSAGDGRDPGNDRQLSCAVLDAVSEEVVVTDFN